jgi:hypothetical protein
MTYAVSGFAVFWLSGTFGGMYYSADRMAAAIGRCALHFVGNVNVVEGR